MQFDYAIISACDPSIATLGRVSPFASKRIQASSHAELVKLLADHYGLTADTPGRFERRRESV